MNRATYIYVLIGVVTVLLSGWRMNLSIFYPYLMNYYGISDITPIAFSVTISSAVAVFSSSFLGVVYDRRGSTAPLYIGALAQLVSALLVWFMKYHQWSVSMWLWYMSGVVSGVGFPALMVSINPTIIRIFSTRPDIALAIVQTSNYLALTFWSPIISKMAFLTDIFAIILVLSIVTMVVMLICARVYSTFKTVRRPQQEIQASEAVPKLFILMLAPIFFIATSSTMLLQFIAPIVTEFCGYFGIDTGRALQQYVPLVMSISGVLQSVGAFAWGFISRRIGVLKSFPLLYASQAVATFLIVVLSGFRLEAVIVALWLRFLIFGGEPVIHMVLIPTLFGQENLGRLLGLQTSTVMISSILGPVVGGLARDLTGTFTNTVLLSSVFSTIATVIALVIIMAGKPKR
ncbi:MAG: MFS transporter [Ignisphaera sp.]|nr:MFS transporter [Ignisphaera sp.]MCX8167658.1 MFS transporter [Ignisphaera sp.]MDW8085648.1 MFS transporter [Ignisphaera sp.]